VAAALNCFLFSVVVTTPAGVDTICFEAGPALVLHHQLQDGFHFAELGDVTAEGGREGDDVDAGLKVKPIEYLYLQLSEGLLQKLDSVFDADHLNVDVVANVRVLDKRRQENPAIARKNRRFNLLFLLLVALLLSFPLPAILIYPVFKRNVQKLLSLVLEDMSLILNVIDFGATEIGKLEKTF
jgi:hypothetical protein